MKISSEVNESLTELLNYNFISEKNDYEESFDVEITDEHYNDPELLEEKDHIFYHILILQQFSNQ